LRSRLRKVREQLSNLIGSAFVSSVGASLWGELTREEIDRESLMRLYRDNPFARQAIDMTVSDAVGSGYFVDAEDPRAAEIVNEFAEKVNLDGILFLCVRDMLVTGDGTAELIYSDEEKVKRTVRWDDREKSQTVIAPVKGARLVFMKWIPSFTLEVERSPLGETMWWKQDVGGRVKYFHPDKILDFRWNPTGLSSYGTSELKSVAELLEDLDTIRELFVKILKRYAAPPIIWKCKGLTKEQIEEHKRKVESKEPDQDIYLNTDLIEPEVLEIDPRGKFENYYTQLVNAVTIGLQTPTLMSLQEATLASSKAMLEFYERKITRIRRVVKRTVEREVFARLVKQAGLTEVPRLRWNVLSRRFEKPGPEFILDLFDRNLLNASQTKAILKKWGIPFPPEEEVESEQGEEPERITQTA